MNDNDIRNNSARAADHFNSYVSEARQKAKVRIFLCGKALDNTLTLQDQVTSHLRAYLWQRLETEIDGCEVFLGEHNQLIAQYDLAMGRQAKNNQKNILTNLARFEITLAKFVNLIVIFPESAGSFAELGMFCLAPELGMKLMLILDRTYEADSSFINRGPVSAARKHRAKIEYMDYTDWPLIYELIREEVIGLFEMLTTQGVFVKGNE